MDRARKYLGNNKKMVASRYLMESYLGRKLSLSEDVHHIDGNKFNDGISNLVVVTKNRHFFLSPNKVVALKEMVKKAQKSNRIISPNSDQSWCGKCSQFKHVSEFTFCSRHWNGLDYECRECKSTRQKRRRHES